MNENKIIINKTIMTVYEFSNVVSPIYHMSIFFVNLSLITELKNVMTDAKKKFKPTPINIKAFIVILFMPPESL